MLAGDVCDRVPDGPGVKKLGRVDAVEDAFARGAVAVNPVRLGTGINVKLLESLAAGLPTVCSKSGARGLDRPGDGMLVVPDRDPAAMARADRCLRIPRSRTASPPAAGGWPRPGTRGKSNPCARCCVEASGRHDARRRATSADPADDHGLAEPWGGAPQRTRRLLAALARCGEPDVLVLRSRYDASSATFGEHRLGNVRVMQLEMPIRAPSALPRFDVPSRPVSRMVARHVDLGAYDLVVSRYVKPAAKLVLPEDVPVIVDFDDAVYATPWRTLGSVRAWLGALARLANDRLVLPLRLKRGRLRRAHYFFCRSADREAFPWLRSSSSRTCPQSGRRTAHPISIRPRSRRCSACSTTRPTATRSSGSWPRSGRACCATCRRRAS